MDLSERFIKHRLLLGVLAFMFVLSLFGNCVLNVEFIGLFDDSTTNGFASEGTQNEFYTGEKGEIAFFSFSAAQTQQQDSNLKTKKSVTYKSLKSSFGRSQCKFDEINLNSDFISISHTRFRRTCPSEDAIS